MTKKHVYVETSAISYLAARPANDILKLAKQRQTQIWWENRHRWELFVAPPVLFEVRRGNHEAALKRLEITKALPLLPEPPEALRLAANLLAAGVMPKNSPEDALHIAIVTVCGMDYLATWNQTHIFNPTTIEKLYSTIRKSGYTPSMLVRPDNLLENEDGS